MLTCDTSGNLALPAEMSATFTRPRLRLRPRFRRGALNLEWRCILHPAGGCVFALFLLLCFDGTGEGGWRRRL